MLKTQIEDGKGRGTQAHIEDDALLAIQQPYPPLLPQKVKIFRDYFETLASSNDIGIDGSVTPVEFYISASADNDRYITAVSFLVGYGTSAGLWEFSDSNAALTNGFRFYYERVDGVVDIHDAIKTNYDLIRLGVKDLLPTAWELRHLGAANDYGYLVTINLQSVMPPYGLKLDKGTTQKLIFEVKDDNTDADTMNVIALGFERFE